MHDEASIFFQTLVSGLVDVPEELRVIRNDDEMGVLLRLTVSQVDMGKVIGKNGRTAIAIRQIMSAYGSRQKMRISVKINNYDKVTGELIIIN